MTDRGGKVDNTMVGSYCSTFSTRIILKLYNIYACTKPSPMRLYFSVYNLHQNRVILL